MNLSQKFDDNSLFRYFSKSYSKYCNPQFKTLNETINRFQKIKNHRQQKSRNSVFRNSLTKSAIISENNSRPRPGFLKYRHCSDKQVTPLNFSLQSNGPIKLYQTNFKKFKDNNCLSLKKITEQSQEFGLRNIVKGIKNQFQLTKEKSKSLLEYSDQSKQLLQYDQLCSKSKQMFKGNKIYNLNAFIVTENLKKFKKDLKYDLKNSIKKQKIHKIHNNFARLSLN